MNTSPFFKPTVSTNALKASALNIQFQGPMEFGLLSPDALMAYCASKLRGLDAQVQAAFAKQKQRSDMSKALSALANELGPKADKDSGGIVKGDETTKQKINAAFTAAIQAAGPDTELGRRLQQQQDHFRATSTPDGGVGDDGVAPWEVKNFLDAVQRIQSDANSEGELEMIQLQSLMSQRQQALQVCTNLVASLGQSAMGIAQNVGK